MYKKYKILNDKVMKYFKVHPVYNSLLHVIAGMGLGIIIARPLIGPHPVRWGVMLVLISILGHLYPLVAEK